MNNQFWFGPSFTWATVWDTIKNMDEYERGVSDAYDAQKNVELQDQTKALLDCQYKTSDGKTKTMNMGGANLGKMEIVIKQAAEANWSSAYKWLWSGQILCRYIQKNPKYVQITNAALAWDISIETWARQIGAMKGTIKQTEQTGEEREYVPTARKWKSWWNTLKNAGMLVGWELIGRQLLWQAVSWFGTYLKWKTVNQTTPEDVSREARYAKYNGLEEKYSNMLKEYNSELETLEAKLYGATPEEAGQIQSQIDLLNAKKVSVEEALDDLWERKNFLPDWKPKTVRETIMEADIKWSDANAAGQLEQEGSILYNTKIKPVLKLSKWEWDVGEILKSITKSDFWWMTEWQRKEMKKIIDKEAAAYSKKYWKVWLEELHKIYDDFDLSKSSLNWEDTQWLYSQFKDVAHTKIRNLINEEWKIVDEAFSDNMLEYSNKMTWARQLRTNAKNDAGRRLTTSVKSDLKNFFKQAKYIRNWWRWFEKWGTYIAPSGNIKRIIKKLTNNPDATEKLVKKWQETVTQPKLVESPTLNRIAETVQKTEEKIENVKNTIKSTKTNASKIKWNKKIPNPKEAILSSLPGFGSPMDFVTVALGDILEMWGVEAPLDVLTEIAAYALESAKLWQPLYDKENSYVNQNPYKDISPLNRWEQASKYYEINWEDVPGYWKEAREAYEAEQWLQQQDWWKELLEEEAKNEKDYKERMDEEDIDIEALIDALN